ncbi:MAG: neutral/alkaline non-lysosomal ceramidase N-terminal domain-containing protein [Gammaproteobacteria bacterium]|nr:neutral/alkaline non-lysosomal ceramidase N-terminal domain-containing protein [Gammaproteobacteria bacterium]
MIVIRLAIVFVPLFILLIGPWPVDNTHFQKTDYAIQTQQYIKSITRNKNESPLKAGSAEVEITPIPGSPLAGYSARDPKENTGAIDKIYAKAISIANNNTNITLLSAEILLPLHELVDAVVLKTGLKRNEIYFTATHTHSGPGGYAHGIVEKASMGDFSQTQFDMLVDALSSAVLKSRSNMQPVELRYSRLQLTPEYAHQFIHNQLFDGAKSHNSIHVLELINTNTFSHLATLLTFSAHPTFLGRLNRKISGDYPNALMRELKMKLGGTTMFSVGAVGSMLPTGDGLHNVKTVKNELRQMNDAAKTLADFISTSLKNNASIDKNKLIKISSWKEKNTTIQSEIVPVLLPYPNYRITDNLRLSPFLVNSIFHDNDTFIHAIKIGKLFFLSYPADYSGELAASLEKWGDQNNAYPWATSFNGEYLGYIMPSEHYDMDHYVTRDVNFFGRWAGDYFEELSKEIISSLK